MRINFLCFLVFILLLSCDKKEQQLHKYYGEEVPNDFKVELNIESFDCFRELVERVNQIVCNDSFPIFKFKSENTTKSVRFYNPCWEGYACILIKQKNVIEIHNDTVYKRVEKNPLENLEFVLRRDLENYGKNPKYCETPEKFLIKISYSDSLYKNIPSVLNKLTTGYENICGTTDLNVYVDDFFLSEPPPPPLPENF